MLCLEASICKSTMFNFSASVRTFGPTGYCDASQVLQRDCTEALLAEKRDGDVHLFDRNLTHGLCTSPLHPRDPHPQAATEHTELLL